MSSFFGYMIDAGTNPFGMHDPNTASRSVLLGGDVISFNFDQFGNDISPECCRRRMARQVPRTVISPPDRQYQSRLH